MQLVSPRNVCQWEFGNEHQRRDAGAVAAIHKASPPKRSVCVRTCCDCRARGGAKRTKSRPGRAWPDLGKFAPVLKEGEGVNASFVLKGHGDHRYG